MLLLLEPIQGFFPRMKKARVDQGHTGKGREWIKEQMEWDVEVVRQRRMRMRGISSKQHSLVHMCTSERGQATNCRETEQ